MRSRIWPSGTTVCGAVAGARTSTVTRIPMRSAGRSAIASQAASRRGGRPSCIGSTVMSRSPGPSSGRSRAMEHPPPQGVAAGRAGCRTPVRASSTGGAAGMAWSQTGCASATRRREAASRRTADCRGKKTSASFLTTHRTCTSRSVRERSARRCGKRSWTKSSCWLRSWAARPSSPHESRRRRRVIAGLAADRRFS